MVPDPTGSDSGLAGWSGPILRSPPEQALPMTEASPPQGQAPQPGNEAQMPARSSGPAWPAPGGFMATSLIIGGGIGCAVALGMAREGAFLAIVRRDGHEDGWETVRLVHAGQTPRQPRRSCPRAGPS
jgi:hypothetical protein